MKVSKEQSARHREQLLDAAGRLLRERGFDKVGVAEIAAAAGLTHGAFYTHFASKEALCEAAVARLSSPLPQASSRDGWQGLVEAYLNPRHANDRAKGCPYAALAGDVPREGTAVKAAFAQSLERWIGTLAEQMPGKSSRKQAIVAAATLVGALTLARAAADAPSRDEILDCARRHLLGPDFVAKHSRRS